MRFDHLELSPTADFHVHLRDGAMAETVTPLIKQGGANIVYVMPNLTPPITTVAAAVAYRDRLQALAPDIKFLMTLYLHPSITPETITEAAISGIAGVKAYPAGVTTNSQAGVLDWQQFYPVFEAMQTHDLVLNLHGEVPGTASPDDEDDVTVLTAEALFMPTLYKIHKEFPKLRIVLEHCTTRDALKAVQSCGPTVGATITAHHLWMTVDDWCGDVFNFCKPVAKTKFDRIALLKAVVDGGNGKFFFGSDSAPHPLSAKQGGRKAAAGCFTQGWATQLVIGALGEGIKRGWIPEKDVSVQALENFLSRNGKRFYHIPEAEFHEGQKIILEKTGERISDVVQSTDKSIKVVPFKSGDEILSLRWA